MTKFEIDDSVPAGACCINRYWEHSTKWLNKHYKRVRCFFRITAIIVFFYAAHLILSVGEKQTIIEPPYIGSIVSKIESELQGLGENHGNAEALKLTSKQIDIELRFIVKKEGDKYLPIVIETGSTFATEQVQHIKIRLEYDHGHELLRKNGRCYSEGFMPFPCFNQDEEDDHFQF